MTNPKDDLDKIIQQRVKEKISQNPQLQEKIDMEVDRDLDTLIEEEVKTVLGQEIEKPEVEEASNKEDPAEFSSPVGTIKGFRKYFKFCWKGVCRPISWVLIAAYVAIIGLMLTCLIFNPAGICLNQGILGAGPYFIYISLFAFLVAIIMSFLSPYSRTALVFSILLSIPLVIILLITSAVYIGLILIGLVLFNLIIQNMRE